MKTIKRSMSILLVLVMLLAALPLSVCLAASSPSTTPADLKDAASRAMQYFLSDLKAEYTPDPSDPDFVPATPDVWEYAALYQAGKTKDADYAFLVPQVNADSVTDDSTPAECAKILLILLMQDKQEDAAQVAQKLAARQAQDGSFTGKSEEVTGYAWAVTALCAAQKAGIEVTFDLDQAVQAIVSKAKEDGGYNDWDEVGNVDATGMVMVGLASAGTDAAKEALAAGVAYLESTTAQQDGYFVGAGQYDCANSCSQAWGLMGLAAAGEDLQAERWNLEVSNLLKFQDEKGGFWYEESRTGNGWSTAPDAMSTYQAILALYDAANNQNFFVTLATQGVPDIPQQPVESVTSVPQETSTPSSSASFVSDNPKTGDEGIPVLVWILLGIAVVAVIVILLVPVMNKKKKK